MGEGDAEVEAPAFMPGEDVHFSEGSWMPNGRSLDRGPIPQRRHFGGEGMTPHWFIPALLPLLLKL